MEPAPPSTTPAPASRTIAKPHLNVAFIGHHRDGKTTLLAALLARLAREPGCRVTPLTVEQLDQIDNPQWRAWRPAYRVHGPITVRPRRLFVETARRALSLVDCPGLRRRIKQTAWAVSAVDVAVLVVSAPDGPQAQTSEHLRLAAAAGVGALIVFLNKCDLLDDEQRADEIEVELRELIERCVPGIDGDDVRVIRGAAAPALARDPLWQDGVYRLIEALEDGVTPPPRDTAPERTLVAIERVYATPPSPGEKPKPRALVGGTIKRGRVVTGERLLCSGLQEKPRVVQVHSIEIDGRPVTQAEAGAHVGMVLRAGEYLTEGSLYPHHLGRGQVLVPASADEPSDLFYARVRLLEPDEGGRHTTLKTGHTVQALIGAAAVAAQLVLVGGGALGPGEDAEVKFRLYHPLLLAAGMTFTFRDGSDGLQWLEGGPCVWGGTVGRGEILRVAARRRAATA